jgi:hypothetical protein
VGRSGRSGPRGQITVRETWLARFGTQPLTAGSRNFRGIDPYNGNALCYQLLSRQEKSLLRRLAIFRAGVTPEAAAAVTQDEMDAAPTMMEINADISSLFRISPQHTFV